MLSYAWNKLEEADTISVGQIDKNDAQNLFGRVLSSGTSFLLRKGLDRGYIEHREETKTIKGKVNLTSTITKNLLRYGKVDCSFDNLSYNVLHNQILKSTISVLLKSKDLDKSIREELLLSYRKLEQIDEINVRKQHFRRLQLSKHNFFYDFLMKICELITDNLLIDEKSGTSKFRDFLENDKVMGHLFEEFVRNFYKKEQKVFNVKREQIHWDARPLDEISGDLLPTMQTDISLIKKDRKIVIDTKYYKETLQERFGKKSIHSDHMYQLYSYIKNLESLGGVNTNCEGILLYPTINTPIKEDYAMQGHKFSVRTIDLNQDWRHIHDDLLKIIA